MNAGRDWIEGKGGLIFVVCAKERVGIGVILWEIESKREREEEWERDSKRESKGESWCLLDYLPHWFHFRRWRKKVSIVIVDGGLQFARKRFTFCLKKDILVGPFCWDNGQLFCLILFGSWVQILTWSIKEFKKAVKLISINIVEKLGYVGGKVVTFVLMDYKDLGWNLNCFIPRLATNTFFPTKWLKLQGGLNEKVAQ